MEALWSDDNNTLYSSLFNLPAGKVAILFATGLKRDAYRATAQDRRRPQLACVRKILYDFDSHLYRSRSESSCCFDATEPEYYSATIVADSVVHTCGNPWQLSMKKNLGCIGVPGIYRLQLNDATAIGVAQVYLDVVDESAVSVSVSTVFFS